MAATARVYTVAEAALLSGVASKAVHNAIDKQIVEARPELRLRGAARRALTRDDLLRLKLWYGVGATLTADRRQRLFEAIKTTPNARTIRADDLLIVDVAEARKQVEAKIRALDEAEATIHREKGIAGGEPVFRGTRIPVRTVAAMLAQGADENEILEGYPALTPHMLELARLWTAAHPVRGRPKRLDELGLKPKSSRRLTLKSDPRSRRSATSG